MEISVDQSFNLYTHFCIVFMYLSQVNQLGVMTGLLIKFGIIKLISNLSKFEKIKFFNALNLKH